MQAVKSRCPHCLEECLHDLSLDSNGDCMARASCDYCEEPFLVVKHNFGYLTWPLYQKDLEGLTPFEILTHERDAFKKMLAMLETGEYWDFHFTNPKMDEPLNDYDDEEVLDEDVLSEDDEVLFQEVDPGFMQRNCPCAWCGEDVENSFVSGMLDNLGNLVEPLAILTTCSCCQEHVIVGFSAGKGNRDLFDCYKFEKNWFNTMSADQIESYAKKVVRHNLDVFKQFGISYFSTGVIGGQICLPVPDDLRDHEPISESVQRMPPVTRDDLHDFYLKELDQLNDPKLWVLGTFTPF